CPCSNKDHHARAWDQMLRRREGFRKALSGLREYRSRIRAKGFRGDARELGNFHDVIEWDILPLRYRRRIKAQVLGKLALLSLCRLEVYRELVSLAVVIQNALLSRDQVQSELSSAIVAAE